MQLAEIFSRVASGGEVAGVELHGTPDETGRRLVSNSPVEVAPLGENELAVFASEIDRDTMPDGLLAAAHRVQATEAVISKDDVFADAGLETGVNAILSSERETAASQALAIPSRSR